jgi:hypothetical protein
LDDWLRRSGCKRQAVEEKRGGNSEAGIYLQMDLVVEIETGYAERGKGGDLLLACWPWTPPWEKKQV